MALAVGLWAPEGAPKALPDAPRSQPAQSVVSGVVVVRNGEVSTPLRRATVTLKTATSTRPRVATTDDEGRFAFSNVVDGRHAVSGRASGHVPTSMPIVVTTSAGSSVDGLELVLVRGAVIAGRVIGPDNDPWPAANVSLIKLHRFGGELTSARVGSTRTNDKGEYRFFGLSPGTYSVVAINSQTDADGVLLTADAWLDPSQIPSASGARGSIAPKLVTFAPTYATATADPSLAEHIAVRDGEVREQADIHLLRVEAATLSGTVAPFEGVMPSNVSLTLVSPSLALGLRPVGLSRLGVRPNGSFASGVLSPGSYRVRARAKSVDGRDLWAESEVILRSGDSIVPTMHLSPAIRIEGVIDTDTAGSLVSEMRLRLVPLETGNPAATAIAGIGGAFTAEGLFPGRYRAFVTNSAGAQAAITQMSLKGPNGTDAQTVGDPIVTLAALPGTHKLAVRISTSPSIVNGKVTDKAGRPVPEFSVILFSADESLWRSDAWTTRLTRPDNHGAYVFENVPPGNYAIAVLGGTDEDALADFAVFRYLFESAVKVKVEANATSTVDLTVIGR